MPRSQRLMPVKSRAPFFSPPCASAASAGTAQTRMTSMASANSWPHDLFLMVCSSFPLECLRGSEQGENQAENQRDNAGPFDQTREDEHCPLDRASLLRLAGNPAQRGVTDKADADADADDRQAHPDARAGRFRSESWDSRGENHQEGNQHQVSETHGSEPPRLGIRKISR